MKKRQNVMMRRQKSKEASNIFVINQHKLERSSQWGMWEWWNRRFSACVTPKSFKLRVNEMQTQKQKYFLT